MIEGFTLLDGIIEKDMITHYMESCLRYILSVRNDIEKDELIQIADQVSVEGSELVIIKELAVFNRFKGIIAMRATNSNLFCKSVFKIKSRFADFTKVLSAFVIIVNITMRSTATRTCDGLRNVAIFTAFHRI